MDVEIGEVVSTVRRPVDGDALLSPAGAASRSCAAVTAAPSRSASARRSAPQAERRVTGGVGAGTDERRSD